MNKKEVSEIRKNFSDKSGFFIMEKILTAFVDGEKNVRCNNVNSCLTMPSEEYEIYCETLKKVLSTNVGKAFVEYEFPNEAYEDGKPQDILYKLLKSEMKDSQACEDFINHIANNFNYSAPYAVITAYCCYTVRRKNRNDDFNDDDDEIYRYILTAVCPAEPCKDGFAFDSDENNIIRRFNTDLIISKSATDGFLYPVFSNRSTDVNHVMYYSKKASDPSISMIEDVLGCTFVMSADDEKASFQRILKNVVGDDLDYMLIQTVNEKIKEVVDENKNETDRAVIDNTRLETILTDIGVPKERVDMVAPVYAKVCGDATLTASNLVEPKTVVSSAGITVNIKQEASDKIRTSVIDGRRCLLIDIDDPTIEINGLPVTLD
ncbi:MAG: DUF4317 domain-containing protein [Ruminococcus sp.]|nr:DUF4317 domain-containing protein [Ruminococcus sp.]